jgi:hypothetical protein
MNAYPSWIHRVPEMMEALALAGVERIDRRLVETLFDLRRTAAKELLRRMGADLCGHSLVISRGLLMARLREAYEHPGYRWEAGKTERRRLPGSITLSPGQLQIRFAGAEDLRSQLLLVLEACDNGFETLAARAGN